MCDCSLVVRRSKGFGFVSYESHEAAARAVEELNGKTFGDREFYVGRAMKKSERNASKRKERQQRFQGVNLYIKNLEKEIDDAELREEFSKFGTITSAKVCVVRGGGGCPVLCSSVLCACCLLGHSKLISCFSSTVLMHFLAMELSKNTMY